MKRSLIAFVLPATLVACTDRNAYEPEVPDGTDSWIEIETYAGGELGTTFNRSSSAFEDPAPAVVNAGMEESFKYGELHDRAKAQLLAAKQMPEPENKVAKAMLSVSINGSTLLNTTTGHLADLMIKGSNMGLSSLWRALNRNGQAGEQSMELARELMDFEENNIKELRKYL